MPFTETITIINSTGNIINSGKHLVQIFKDAKAAYHDRKEKRAVKASFESLKRTFTVDLTCTRRDFPVESHEPHRGSPLTVYCDHGRSRRYSADDGRSQALSRRNRSDHHSARRIIRIRSSSHRRFPLTESNLHTFSKVSSTKPLALHPRGASCADSPYAETIPRGPALSRFNLALKQPDHYAPSAVPSVLKTARFPHPPPTEDILSPIPRLHSESNRGNGGGKPRNEIDINMAYGSVPPDLASRTDLAPEQFGPVDNPEHNGGKEDKDEEAEARTLMSRIEAFLEEADCIHHTASAMIASLQSNPEAAAAVALALAELSTLLCTMSPAFLSVIKGGAPAVFSLLASPQFLIGVGVAVGVTVVMFGGWKIVKKINGAKNEKLQAGVFEMQATTAVKAAPGTMMSDGQTVCKKPYFSVARGPSSVDEALVLEEELSTIESWRRGIVPFREDATVDVELMSPEAERALRSERKKHRQSRRDPSRCEKVVDVMVDDGIDPSDSVSRIGLGNQRHHHRLQSHSSRHRHYRSDQSSAGRSQHSSHRSRRSDTLPERTSSSRTATPTPRAIEERICDTENSLESVMGTDKPNKEKSGGSSMLKTLFRKKHKEGAAQSLERERQKTKANRLKG